MKKKIAVLTFLLLAFASYAGATCNTDILNEYINPFYAGVPGSFSLEACCGTPGYTFSIYSGSLPAGVTMNSSGVISGTATSTGYTTVCITVTDAAGCHVTRCYEVYVF